ncbi:MAG: hypothetical protein ACTSUE_22550 [Promethearchaeota archaeon]
MKRVLTYDFLRGIAIIGVILFHVMNVVFADMVDNIKNSLSGPVTVGPVAIGLGVVILYFGNFSGLFVMISAGSNVISIRKQWDRMMERGTTENQAFRKILGTQTIRGLLVYFFGFFSEGLIASLFSKLLGEDNIIAEDLVNSFFLSNILHCIGVTLIFSSLIYLVFLRYKTSRQKMNITLLIMLAVVLAIQPVIRTMLTNAGYEGSFKPPDIYPTWYENYAARGFWQNLGFAFLTPLIGRVFPLIPMISGAFIGIIISVHINQKAINPAFIKKTAWTSLIVLGCGIVYGYLLEELGVQAFDVDVARSVGWHIIVLAGEIFSMIFIIYFVDFRKKTKTEVFKKHTVTLRRFGLATLTLWNLQYLSLIPAIVFELFGWEVLDGGLNTWQLLIVLFAVFAFWHLIIWLWESKGKFKGSLEWLTTMVLSRGSASADRMKIQEVLYNPERMIEWVPGKKKRKNTPVETTETE